MLLYVTQRPVRNLVFAPFGRTMRTADTPVTTRSALSTLWPVGQSVVAPLVGVAIWYPQPDLWTSLASTARRPVTATKATAQASICEGRFFSRCGSGQPDGSDRRGTWGGAGVTQSC